MIALALAPLRAPDFRLLLAARASSLFGTAMAPIGIAFAVLQATGSVGDLGLVLSAQAGAMVLALPLAGVAADRYERRRILLAADGVSAVAQAATAGVVLLGGRSILLLAVLQAGVGAGRGVVLPALTGLVPQVLPSDLRQQGNALVGMSRNLTMLLGGPVGGLVAVLLGPPAAIAVDALSYAVAACCWSRVHVRVARGAAGGLVAELREGWREFSSRTWLWAIVLQFTVLVVFVDAGLDVLAPAVARERLGGPSGLGLVLGAEALGALLAGIAALRLRVRRPLLVATLGCFAGVPEMLLLAWSSSLPLVCLGGAVTGAGFATFGVLWDTTLQDLVPPDALSRVSSYDGFGSTAMLPVGLALTGPLVAIVGLSGALVVAAAGLVVPTVLVLAVRDVRRPLEELRGPVAGVPASAELLSPA